MTNILQLLILFYCHMIQVSGVFKWTVMRKATDYGQNVTLFCHVPNCCPEDAGWDRWTPQQRTLFIDVKTGRPNKKYDGKIFKNGYTLIIQNLSKDDLNVSYSCLYGVTLGDIKFLLEEDVFTYASFASKISVGEIAGIIVGVLLVVTVVFLVYFRIHKRCSHGDDRGRGSVDSVSTSNIPEFKAESKPDCAYSEVPSKDPEDGTRSDTGSDDRGRGSVDSVLTSNIPEFKAESKPDCAYSEVPSNDSKARPKSEPDCYDRGRGSVDSVSTSNNPEFNAESKPDCSAYSKVPSKDPEDGTRSDTGSVAKGSGSAYNEVPSNDSKARPKSEPDCCDGGRGSADSVLTSNNREVEAESKPDCTPPAEQKESTHNKVTSNDHKDKAKFETAREIQNEKNKKEYMDAIQSTYEVRKYVRIQVIGKDGVGKTSLVRRLLNQDLEGVTSTDGIDINRKCHIKEGDGTWTFNNGQTEMEKIGNRILHAIKLQQMTNQPNNDDRHIAEHELFETEKNETPKDVILLTVEETKQHLSSRVTDEAETLDINETVEKNDNDPVTTSLTNIPGTSNKNSDDNSDDNSNHYADQITEAMVAKMDEITSYLENTKETMTDEGLIECGIWDFAGQKEYYATHQTFLTTDAIYLLVVDIKDDLKKVHYDDQFNFDSSGDYIDFWLDSIHCYCEDIKNSTANDKKPTVIMVCTGIDKLEDSDEDIEMKKKEYQKKFLTIFGSQEKGKHVRGVINFISNLKSPEEDFTNLRDQISGIAKEMRYFAEDLPTKWIQLESTLALLKDLKKREKLGYFEKLENIEKLAKTISIEKDELLIFLKFQHKIGNVIFFEDKSDYVILQPKWLVDCFRCLICDNAKKSCNATELYNLDNWGKLSDSMIDKLFSKVPELMFGQLKPHILGVMEKFDIVVKPKSVNAYYIPCMITEVSSLENIKEKFKVGNQLCTPWLILVFEFLPIAYYNHILFMYIREKTVCQEKPQTGDGRPALYAGKAVVYLDTTKRSKLVICFSRNSISLQIWNNKDMNDNTYRKIVEELCKKIEDLETKLGNELQYKIQSKCSTGDYVSSSGRISYGDLNTLCVGEKYYCEEHECEHKEDIQNIWFKNAVNIIPRYPEYKSIKKRLKTFNKWSNTRQQTPTILASAGFFVPDGFFYPGQGDRVQCFFCAGIICQWNENDVPRKEHKRLFPSCPFIKKIYNQSHQTTENSKTSD